MNQQYPRNAKCREQKVRDAFGSVFQTHVLFEYVFRTEGILLGQNLKNVAYASRGRIMTRDGYKCVFWMIWGIFDFHISSRYQSQRNFVRAIPSVNPYIFRIRQGPSTEYRCANSWARLRPNPPGPKVLSTSTFPKKLLKAIWRATSKISGPTYSPKS